MGSIIHHLAYKYGHIQEHHSLYNATHTHFTVFFTTIKYSERCASFEVENESLMCVCTYVCTYTYVVYTKTRGLIEWQLS